MRQNLILLSAICLVLAGVTNASVKKGDVELEIYGGWVMEETSSVENPLPSGFEVKDFLSEGTGTDLSSWMVMLGLSRFATDNLQLGIAGFYTPMEGDKETFSIEGFEDIEGAQADVDMDLTAFGIGGRAKWHFNPTGQWVPYIGVQAFWVSADVDVKSSTPNPDFEELLPPGSKSNSPSGILWGPVAGLRCELGDQDELLLEYQYHLWAGDVGDILDNGHGFFLGLSHRLK